MRTIAGVVIGFGFGRVTRRIVEEHRVSDGLLEKVQGKAKIDILL